MYRLAIVTILTVYLLATAITPSMATPTDSSSSNGARFAAGLALPDGAPVGTLALITPVHGRFFNVTSLAPTGPDGSILSQVYADVYTYKSFTLSAAIGTGVDIISNNPDYDDPVTYLSSCNGLFARMNLPGSATIHASILWSVPTPPDRNCRYYLMLSLPISAQTNR